MSMSRRTITLIYVSTAVFAVLHVGWIGAIVYTLGYAVGVSHQHDKSTRRWRRT